MRVRACLWSVALVLIAACGAGAPDDRAADASSAAEEAVAVEEAVRSFFGALEAMDFEALESTVTTDFELVEDTLVLDMPGFIAYVEPLADAGASIRYEFSDFNTEVRGPVAWTRYRNRAVLSMDGQKSRYEWLESAVLEDGADGWKIDRLQSAPVAIEPVEE